MSNRHLLVVTLLISLISTNIYGQEKSLRKALFLSIILPGAGQRYLGNNKRANAMMAGEAGIWCSFYGFRLQGKMREERYKQIAELFGGIKGDKSDGYYRLMSRYASSEEYNIDVLRIARELYPYDREKQLEHFQQNGYFNDDGWRWDSLDRMKEFKRVRVMSREAYRRSVLVTGFAVLNRIVSAMDVYLWFRLNHTKVFSEIDIRVENPEPGRFILYLSKPLP